MLSTGRSPNNTEVFFKKMKLLLDEELAAVVEVDAWSGGLAA